MTVIDSHLRPSGVYFGPSAPFSQGGGDPVTVEGTGCLPYQSGTPAHPATTLGQVYVTYSGGTSPVVHSVTPDASGHWIDSSPVTVPSDAQPPPTLYHNKITATCDRYNSSFAYSAIIIPVVAGVFSFDIPGARTPTGYVMTAGVPYTITVTNTVAEINLGPVWNVDGVSYPYVDNVVPTRFGYTGTIAIDPSIPAGIHTINVFYRSGSSGASLKVRVTAKSVTSSTTPTPPASTPPDTVPPTTSPTSAAPAPTAPSSAPDVPTAVPAGTGGMGGTTGSAQIALELGLGAAGLALLGAGGITVVRRRTQLH